ncbi:SGNH/GDSL hydrolase family protein [Bacillus niameyensis]|uniref:SGNH/GDSL hydrolase family protein n=1 Tax=Bacillus niameyensis TaxID=1522308 RepID=UPI00078294F8|nr:SGNH/GDSL hydrolase family protein [Bacillus niameyensis]
MPIPQIIRNLANKVRNEIYGKDVREALAQSMEVTGETADTAKKTADEQLERVDRLIKENPQPSEVVDARGNHPLLGDRLDSFTSQLADKANEDEVRKKAEPITVNDFDSETLGIIQDGAGGTPINVLSTPKSHSVTVESTTFLQSSGTNLFNKETASVGKAIYTTGEIIDSADYFLSDFIPIKPSTTYIAKSMGSRVFYSDNRQYVSGESYSVGNKTTTPNNAFFIRFAFDKYSATLENQMFVEGSTLPSEYIPYGIYKNVSFRNLEFSPNAFDFVEAKKVARSVVTPTNTTFLYVSLRNLFNKSDVEVNKSITAGGVISDNTDYVLSGFIPVVAGKKYTAKSMASRAFYNHNKVYVSGESYASGNTTTIPNGVSYIRFCFPKTDATLEDQMFVEGETLPNEYVPYTKKQAVTFTDDYQFEIPSRLKGKKWNALGDSITNGLQVTSYHQQIASKTGCIVRNYGISSSTVADYGNWEINPMVLRYQDMDDDADIITVFGGVNDAGSGVPIGSIDSTDIKTFMGAYNVLLSGLIAKYPTNLIATFTPLQQTDSPRNTKQIANAVKEVSAKWGIPCLDLYSMSGFNSANMDYYTLDKLHPNTLGHSVIAGKMLSFLENNLPITA